MIYYELHTYHKSIASVYYIEVNIEKMSKILIGYRYDMIVDFTYGMWLN